MVFKINVTINFICHINSEILKDRMYQLYNNHLEVRYIYIYIYLY